MADTINTAQAPTLAGTMPELQAALAQAAAGLPPEVIQQGLGAAAAFNPMLAQQAARRQNELKPSMAQAEAAAKAYEAQAAAPPPEISGARAGLNELLGSVASIISGNQTYRESAATRLQKEQQALLDSRSQNLTRLKDLYDKRAEAAKSLGNDIAEEENRIKKDRIEKALEPINKAREHQYQMEQIRTQAAEARRTDAAKAANGPEVVGDEGQVKSVMSQTGEPIKYINASDFTPKERTALRQKYAGTDVLVVNKNDSDGLAKLADVDQNLNAMFGYLKSMPASYSGPLGAFKAMARQVETGAASKLNVGSKETLDMVKGIEAMRSTAIQMVQAFASLGTGLRVNQAEINAVLTMDYPSPSDTRQTAATKLRTLKGILGRIQNSIVAGRNGAPMERPLTVADANEKNIGKVVYVPDTQQALMVVRVRNVPSAYKGQFKPGEIALVDVDDPNLDKKYFDMNIGGGR